MVGLLDDIQLQIEKVNFYVSVGMTGYNCSHLEMVNNFKRQ